MGEAQSEAEENHLGGGAQADRGGAAGTVGESQERGVKESGQSGSRTTGHFDV